MLFKRALPIWQPINHIQVQTSHINSVPVPGFENWEAIIMASAVAQAYKGVCGLYPSGVQGQRFWSGYQVDEVLKLNAPQRLGGNCC